LPAVTDRVGTAEHKELALEVSTLAITLVRDEAGLLPLTSPETTLVIETPAAAGLGSRVGANTLQVSEQPTPIDIAAALEMAEEAGVVVIATSDAQRNSKQAELVQMLQNAGSPVVVAAVRSPYDLLVYPQITTYLVSYGSNPPGLEALAQVLVGQAEPGGKLPVELPGVQ
jgi:beta-N-acetylhexosaminidase